MAASTRSSGQGSLHPSTAAKPAAGDAGEPLPPKGRGVRSAAKLVADGISVTTTSTAVSTVDPSTPVATKRRQRTQQPVDKNKVSDSKIDSPPGYLDLSVLAAVERDIEAIRLRDPALAVSALAASARRLATAMDHPDSTTSLSMCSKALLDTMDRLRELCPPEEKVGKLDDLAARRSARLAGEPTPTDLVGP